MGKRGDSPRRSDITDTVHKQETDMSEKVEDLDTIASDAETVRETLESLDFDETAEGTDEVESAIERADDVTVEKFDDEDGNLEELQGESEEYEGELRERSDSSQTDLGKISDASGRIETQETVNELVTAKEGVLRDIEFLDGEIEKANDARTESEREQEQHRARILGGRR